MRLVLSGRPTFPRQGEKGALPDQVNSPPPHPSGASRPTDRDSTDPCRHGADADSSCHRDRLTCATLTTYRTQRAVNNSECSPQGVLEWE